MEYGYSHTSIAQRDAQFLKELGILETEATSDEWAILRARELAEQLRLEREQNARAIRELDRRADERVWRWQLATYILAAGIVLWIVDSLVRQ